MIDHQFFYDVLFYLRRRINETDRDFPLPLSDSLVQSFDIHPTPGTQINIASDEEIAPEIVIAVEFTSKPFKPWIDTNTKGSTFWVKPIRIIEIDKESEESDS